MAYLKPAETDKAVDQMFPTLTPEQQTRVAALGQLRHVVAGETLVEPDSSSVKFFVSSGDCLSRAG